MVVLELLVKLPWALAITIAKSLHVLSFVYDTSHTLTSLQPGTTYRIEVEAVRKGDRADGQRAKVTGNFTTEGEGEERML